MNLALLHGFLGSHRDYTLVFNELKKNKVRYKEYAPDFFKAGPCSAAHDYDVWCKNFLSELEKRFGPEPVVLVGYSLGARLALHAYFAAPQKFSRLLLLAANPGILQSTPHERRQWEQNWADCFRRKPWEEAMAAWNQQQVFAQATPRLVPQEGQLDRELVADSLSRWSLLTHLYSLDDLRRLPQTVEWWYGQLDQKFMAVKAELERLKVPGQYQVIANTGHRLTLDAAEVLAQALMTGGPR
ncbi:MAG: alpha/beta fold hydrolase [Bdellovibrionales bacterium]